jgi:putative heme iron utilization protein
MTTAQSAGAQLIQKQRWLALATIDDAGDTEISYAPFAAHGGAFGIVVSRLAAHTANLLAGRSASVLIVDEAEMPDSYARSRFSIAVTPRVHAPGSAEANLIWTALEARQGTTVQTLRMLPDFTPISLEPGNGRLVLGFAAAHNVAAAIIKEMLDT